MTMAHDELWQEIHKSLPDRLRLIEARDPAPPPRVVSREQEFRQDGYLPGPGAPIVYSQADNLPRLYDYNYASNKIIVPRGEYGVLPSFFHLYSFFLQNDEVRIGSGWNTNQILGVKRDVRPREGKRRGVDMSRWEAAKRLVDYPDPTLDWSYEQWMRALLQEKNITDAVTVYPLKTYGGEIIAWQLIDGQTIKPILSYQGGRPLPPAPAYVQYIKGYPFKPFDLNSLVYMPSRPRVWCAYGESRVEEILNTLAALTLFADYTNDWFTEGNIPEAMMTLPESYFKGDGVTVAKRVANYQQILDEHAGVTTTRRRFHIPPVPADKVTLLKQFDFKREMPEWYVRKVCVQFGCPPALFVAETNRATAQQTSVDLGDSVFRADLTWCKRLVDRLLAMSGFGDFEMTLRPTRSFKMIEVQGLALLQAQGILSNEQVLKALDMEEEPENLVDALDDAPEAAEPGGAPGAASGGTGIMQPELAGSPAVDVGQLSEAATSEGMNGAQVDALVQVAQAISAQTLTQEAARGIIVAAFPLLSPKIVTMIVGNIKAPVVAAGQIESAPAPSSAAPAVPVVERAKPLTGKPVARGDKAEAYQTMATKSKLAAKMLKAVTPLFAERGRKVEERAKRLAAGRGKKVTGA